MVWFILNSLLLKSVTWTKLVQNIEIQNIEILLFWPTLFEIYYHYSLCMMCLSNFIIADTIAE